MNYSVEGLLRLPRCGWNRLRGRPLFTSSRYEDAAVPVNAFVNSSHAAEDAALGGDSVHCPDICYRRPLWSPLLNTYE